MICIDLHNVPELLRDAYVAVALRRDGERLWIDDESPEYQAVALQRHRMLRKPREAEAKQLGCRGCGG